MKNLKRAAGLVILAGILAFGINTAANVLERKSSDFKYAPFFEQDEDFDVLFMGTSHVMQGIFPMELWNDYGIVSYNFGGHSNRLPTTYWVMENALNYTNPKLVVIDMLFVGSREKVSDNSDFIHLSFDCFPLTWTKIKGIYDLCDDPDAVDKNGVCYYDCRLEYIWDFGKYHSRWAEITENDFTNSMKTKEKGAESRIAVSVPPAYSLIPESETFNIDDTAGVEYLRKMIEDCKARGIDVLLINLPYPAGEMDQRTANSVNEIAREYDIDYINFVAMDNVVDYSIDCFDAEHLNPSGARKVTDYLGQYIKDHYDIPDRRETQEYASWYDDYSEYTEDKKAAINNADSLETELMLLADRNFSSSIHIKDGSAVLQDERIQRLLENIPDLTIQSDDMSGLYNSESLKPELDVQVAVTEKSTGELISASGWKYTAPGTNE